MKGSILGFDGATGAIVSDTDVRFRFTAGDWKGDRPPRNGETVDFVASDETASDIYPVRGGGNLAADFSGSLDRLNAGLQNAGGGLGEHLLALAKSSPQAICAAIILVASFLFSFMSFGAGVQKMSGSLVGLTGDLAKLSRQSEAALDQFEGSGGFMSELRSLHNSDLVTALHTQLTVISLSWLLYLVPLLAIAVLYATFRERRIRLLELGLGAMCLISAGYYLVLRESSVEVTQSLIGSSAGMMRSAFSLDLGGWVILISGIVALLVAFGVIRTPEQGAAPQAI